MTRTKRFCIMLVAVCAVLMAGLPALAADGLVPDSFQRPKDVPDIEAFVREGCPHCRKAEEFLAKLRAERPGLRIVIHDVGREPPALENLKRTAERLNVNGLRVPAFRVGGRLIFGYSDESTSGRLILEALAESGAATTQKPAEESVSCRAEESLSCGPEPPSAGGMGSERDSFEIEFLGHKLSLNRIGLPLFTLAMGLLDGFNPCSMWVLILMISLLAPMNNRMRMFAVAGTFVAVEGVAYYLFMAAWLNLFLLVGLSRASELAVAGIAILAGAINLKDFWAFGFGVSLSIPKSAKPGIYARIRGILQAKNLVGALVGAAILAVLVQIVEFLCTSGFPALYTRILTLRQLEPFAYYGYLLLYNVAYMLDDVIVLTIGIVTLSQRRLQEREGRWLKLISGTVMVGLGLYLAFGGH